MWASDDDDDDSWSESSDSEAETSVSQEPAIPKVKIKLGEKPSLITSADVSMSESSDLEILDIPVSKRTNISENTCVQQTATAGESNAGRSESGRRSSNILANVSMKESQPNEVLGSIQESSSNASQRIPVEMIDPAETKASEMDLSLRTLDGDVAVYRDNTALCDVSGNTDASVNSEIQDNIPQVSEIKENRIDEKIDQELEELTEVNVGDEMKEILGASQGGEEVGLSYDDGYVCFNCHPFTLLRDINAMIEHLEAESEHTDVRPIWAYNQVRVNVRDLVNTSPDMRATISRITKR